MNYTNIMRQEHLTSQSTNVFLTQEIRNGKLVGKQNMLEQSYIDNSTTSWRCFDKKQVQT